MVKTGLRSDYSEMVSSKILRRSENHQPTEEVVSAADSCLSMPSGLRISHKIENNKKTLAYRTANCRGKPKNSSGAKT
jgi:hypothetical protein